MYNVLPFRLTGGPSSWQYYINEKLFKFLGDFCLVYLDNILIYSNTLEEHKQHVTQVLERLQAAGLQVDIRVTIHTITSGYCPNLLSQRVISCAFC